MKGRIVSLELRVEFGSLNPLANVSIQLFLPFFLTWLLDISKMELTLLSNMNKKVSHIWINMSRNQSHFCSYLLITVNSIHTLGRNLTVGS